MDDPNSFFSTLSVDELHRVVTAHKGDVGTDVFRALGSPSGLASKFAKNLAVVDFPNTLLSFPSSTLYIGLAAKLLVARNQLELCGKVFSRFSLYGKMDNQRMTIDRRIHFENFATLIAPFMLPEIELEIVIDGFDGFDSHLVEIFTKKFGKSVKDVRINAFDVPFTLQCFNLPPSLKSFEYIGMNLHKLDPLWELVGDNLEKVHLSIDDDLGWKSCIAKLQAYCRKLSTIDLKSPLEETGVEEDDILELLCSYGKKLIHADLTGLGTEACSRIAKECINLRCHITISIDIPFASDGFPQFPALHNRVRSMDIYVGERFRIDWSKLSYAMQSCGSIIEMKIRGRDEDIDTIIPHEFTRAIFPKPGRVLETFNVQQSVFCSSDSIALIAKSTGTLKTLKLNVLFPIHPTAFASICKANTQLEDICIMESEPPAGENITEEGTRQLVTELVRAVAPCKSLKHSSLRFRARNRPKEVFMRDIQVPFRTRLVEFEAIFMG